MNNLGSACQISCDNWVDNFDDSYDYDFSKTFDAKMQKLIDKMRNDKYHRLTRKTITALIVAAIILSIATTVLAVQNTRKHTVKQFSDYFTYGVSDTANANYIKDFTVGYVPSGFEQTECVSSDACFSQNYSSDEYWFTIDKNHIGVELFIDNTGEEEIKCINGIEYLIYHTDSTNGIIWNEGSYLFVISGNISGEEILKIALNIE